ncbi:unnamed protein product [Notodromas monacha]|uniref:Histidine-rich glycoprotein-like n=1 Tax=Notodromas monacha TaxID=399045 RepID=A0A7R9BL35_9CRUS|nr:unnamed protein product [Notodromas monacha]CAG0917471.1 unnamed protein product [Notodromas monacha]
MAKSALSVVFLVSGLLCAVVGDHGKELEIISQGMVVRGDSAYNEVHGRKAHEGMNHVEKHKMTSDEQKNEAFLLDPRSVKKDHVENEPHKESHQVDNRPEIAAGSDRSNEDPNRSAENKEKRNEYQPEHVHHHQNPHSREDRTSGEADRHEGRHDRSPHKHRHGRSHHKKSKSLDEEDRHDSTEVEPHADAEKKPEHHHEHHNRKHHHEHHNRKHHHEHHNRKHHHEHHNRKHHHKHHSNHHHRLNHHSEEHGMKRHQSQSCEAANHLSEMNCQAHHKVSRHHNRRHRVNQPVHIPKSMPHIQPHFARKQVDSDVDKPKLRQKRSRLHHRRPLKHLLRKPKGPSKSAGRPLSKKLHKLRHYHGKRTRVAVAA